MKSCEILIVGGGAAGMMSAIKAAEAGCSVTLLEKNSFCGKKINITGKGRCNITNTRKWNEFSEHVHPSAAFARSAFYNFSNEALVDYLLEIGLETVVERGERVFPASMKASDVSRTLVERMEELGVQILYDCDVIAVRKSTIPSATDARSEFICTYAHGGGLTHDEVIAAQAVVIATGGLSYPSTGSTGTGLEIARSFGLEVSETFPSLTALTPERYDLDLEWIELKNVGLNLFIDKDLIQLEQGDLTFTSGGIEGALGFRLSRKAVKALRGGSRVELELDLKPALSIETLNRRIEREIAIDNLTLESEMGPVKMRNLLRGLLPEALIKPFLNANPDLKLRNLSQRLKGWRFRIISYVGYERSVVTAGGVSQKEIIPKSMCSRKVEGLYFAGEVLDLDGDTGGYNLQLAFSTGALAGEKAAQQILNARSES